MPDFLYFNTPLDQFQGYYNNIQLSFNANAQTQLPKNVVMIRTLAVAVFTGLAALKLASSAFFMGSAVAVIAGVAFIGWTLYTHISSKDSLLEAFYKISGGKEKFEQLPEIQLSQNPNEKISEAIKRLNWSELNKISKTKTLDGRRVVIVRGLDRADELNGWRTQAVLAFIEKVSPGDLSIWSSLPDLGESIMHAIFFPHRGNTFGGQLWHHSCERKGATHNKMEEAYCKVYSSISKEMANELYAQLANS